MKTPEQRAQHAEYMRRWRAGEIAPRRTREYRKEEIGAVTTLDAPLPQPTVDVTATLPEMPKHGYTIALVMDVQAKHGVDFKHLNGYGYYIAEHRPDIVLCIGDFADMRSLNRHDGIGSMKRENQRYVRDIDATKRAMDALMLPIERAYDPTKIMLYGNHEDLITRYADAHPEMEGAISLTDLGYEDRGWLTVPFLQPIVIGGVAFCHYFPTGVMGRPIQTPQQLLRDMGMSCVAGHQQGRQIAWARRADGGERCGLITGSFYTHDENYMSPLQNRHWRGTYVLHEVRDGSFAEMALTCNYLLRRWA